MTKVKLPKFVQISSTFLMFLSLLLAFLAFFYPQPKIDKEGKLNFKFEYDNTWYGIPSGIGFPIGSSFPLLFFALISFPLGLLGFLSVHFKNRILMWIVSAI
jgi:hypothetical protein